MEPQALFMSQQHPLHRPVIEKSIIIKKEENGFGFTVTGHTPVYVSSVLENGAAWKAGVRRNDLIIKVNGTNVKTSNHQEVVGMIQDSAAFVNLTLYSNSDASNTSSITATLHVNNDNHLTTSQSSSSLHNNSLSNNNIQHANACHPHFNQQLHNNSNLSSLNANANANEDDTFHDTSRYFQLDYASSNQSLIANNSSNPLAGVSKLTTSGPNPFTPKHLHLSKNISPKSKSRLIRNQSTTRDNPYYYYKSNPSDKVDLLTGLNQISCPDQLAPSSRSTSSIARSRSSSSKLPTRSLTSGKYKSRKLGTRFVEDLRSLTISSSQPPSSSLSTSPSSSDLSDCDEQNPPDYSFDISNNASGNYSQSNDQGLPIPNQQLSGTTKQTTRRLKVIKELIDTEKTHTERLKHLNDLLYKPIKAESLVPIDQLKMVFSCHKTLLKIHRQIYKLLLTAQANKSRHTQEPLIGETLVEIFESELGKRLERAACTFCACQATNTELLNRFTRKDTKVGEFLSQVASQQLLGRLGIKDLLASCFQRVTKYPLLLENLLKEIPTDSLGIHTKSLSDGSIATRLAQNTAITSDSQTALNFEQENSDQSLKENADTTTTTSSIDVVVVPPTNSAEIQDVKSSSIQTEESATTNNNNLVTSKDNNDSATKVDSSVFNSVHETSLSEYNYERMCIKRALHQSRQILVHVDDAVKRAVAHNRLKEIWKRTDKNPGVPVIDIATQQLLHDGPLTLRLAKRSFDVHVLLLTHYLVILTREGQDKYKLKFFPVEDKLKHMDENGKPTNIFSPIFNIDEHLETRQAATDENGFYLLCKHKAASRIYEFACQSPAERAKWKEKIHKAIKIYNFANVPDDDNTLTRYRELISLEANNTNGANATTTATNANSVDIAASAASTNAAPPPPPPPPPPLHRQP